MFSSQNSQVSNDAVFVEDVFSTYLYTGNGSTQTITNGIDLSTKGGLVWTKSRSDADRHMVIDTNRGINKTIYSNDTASQSTDANTITAISNTGYTLGSHPWMNTNNATYASWTFREQPKFFDVVTYTGNGVAGRPIDHNLGSVPGCIIVKRTDTTSDWQVYHRANTAAPATDYLVLNSNANTVDLNTVWDDTPPSASVFYVGTNATVNASGGTYVAYLFAHDAGGFGLTGTDNVISCGNYTGNGSATGPVVTLGYEPQWLMIKKTDGAGVGAWMIIDNMRGMPVGSNTAFLAANLTDAESATIPLVSPTATGFNVTTTNLNLNTSGATYIYIAIRRGPMKTPTAGTSVLGLSQRIGTGSNATVTGSAGVTDLAIIKRRNSTSNWVWTPRLAGTGYLSSNLTAAETAAGTTILQANPWDVMDGIKVGTTSTLTNASGSTFINYLIDRAPSFFDVVCYTGTGSARTVTHNLGAVPELMIVKERSAVNGWPVYASTITNAATGFLLLNSTDAFASPTAQYWNNTAPTSSVFTVGTNSAVNASTQTFVAYLFATCAGVSKVGSYTGNGSTQTINCGFTGGARFVLIKSTTAVESWHIFDTARGMVAGTDPRLRPNTTDSENTGNWVYTATTGFEIVTSDAAVNSTGNNYIFLAIA